jgi:hypothetical protein
MVCASADHELLLKSKVGISLPVLYNGIGHLLFITAMHDEESRPTTPRNSPPSSPPLKGIKVTAQLCNPPLLFLPEGESREQ